MLDALQAAPAKRLTVRELAEAIFPSRTLIKLKAKGKERMMHQRVGTVVYRLNQKRKRFNIRPLKGEAGVYVLRKA